MPVKYDGNNCGISVSIFGLSNDCTYGKISISIEDEEHEVTITDQLQTTVATFSNLTENQYYTVVAKIISNDNIKVVQCKIVPSIAKSVRGTTQPYRGFGGMPKPAAKCRGKAL